MDALQIGALVIGFLALSGIATLVILSALASNSHDDDE